MWIGQVLRMYGVDWKLIKGMKSFYFGNRVSVRINVKLSNWFEIKDDVRQWCTVI